MRLESLLDLPPTVDPVFARHRLHTARVHAIAALDDGTALSGGEDGQLLRWDPTTGAIAATLEGHRGPVNDVRAEGALRVTAHDDGTARIWEGDALAQTLGGHPRFVRQAAFAGDQVVTACEDGMVRVFDRATGVLSATLEGHRDGVQGLAVGARAAVTTSPDHAVLAWELDALAPAAPLYDAGGKVLSAGRTYLATPNTTAVGHPGAAPDRVEACPGGFLTGAEGVIRWSYPAREALWHTRLAWPVVAIAVHGDGVFVATHTAVIELDLAHGAVRRRLAWGHRGATALAVVGGTLVVGSGDGTIGVVDLARWSDPPHHATTARTLAADGRWGASRDGDGVVCVFDLAAGRLVRRLSPRPEPNEHPIALADDTLLLGCDGPDLRVSRWRLPDCAPESPLTPQSARPGSVSGLAVQDSAVFVGPGSPRQSLRRWALDTGAVDAFDGATGQVSAAVQIGEHLVTLGYFRRSGSTSMFGDNAAHLQGWHVPTRALVWTVATADTGEPFSGPRFGQIVRLGDRFVAGSGRAKGEACIWDPATGERGEILPVEDVHAGVGGEASAWLMHGLSEVPGQLALSRLDADGALTELDRFPDTLYAWAFGPTCFARADEHTLTITSLAGSASVLPIADVVGLAVTRDRVLVAHGDGRIGVVAIRDGSTSRPSTCTTSA